MLVAVESIRLTWGGTLIGSEIWQCQLTAGILSGGPALSQAQLNSQAALFQNRVATFMASVNVGTLVSTGTTCNRVRAYHVPANSNTADLVADGGTINVSGSVAPKLPNQCSLVVSLRSSNPGRRGRGRFYLPALGATITTGVMSAPPVAGLATEVDTFLTGVNTDLATLAIGAVLLSGSALAPLNRITIDNVVDTQRRRRNGVAATATGSQPI